MTCNETVPYAGGQYACTNPHRLAVRWMHSNRDGEAWLYWYYDQHGEPVVIAL
ncbi:MULTISPECIES: hypothetical protein [unclassified Microbacterium]|uniref:hypothetical protein n=1 Tax=unclassified Microbacterium TaxID=2609290 RepID=UPI00148503C6|nr:MULTISPECIES: hypothetical protein [unclassified Microbacterium]